MENETNQVAPPASTEPIQPSKSSSVVKKKLPVLGVIFGFLFLATLLAAVYFGYQYRQQVNKPNTTSTSTNKPSPTATEWKTAKYGGIFSFEYPFGWHVGILMQENQAENGTMIVIDPDPINTSPRGGPLGTFMIYVYNGNPDPDEILDKKISVYGNSNEYSNIAQETINGDIGKIYYFKGKIAGEMYKGEPVESYIFTFNQNPNDLINQQVVMATMILKDDPQLSAMLKHIVLSIKKLTP